MELVVENGEEFILYSFDEDEDEKIDAYGIDKNNDGEIDRIIPAS